MLAFSINLSIIVHITRLSESNGENAEKKKSPKIPKWMFQSFQQYKALLYLTKKQEQQLFRF